MNEIVKSGVCSKVCVMYYGSIKASILLITLLSIYLSVVRKNFFFFFFFFEKETCCCFIN